MREWRPIHLLAIAAAFVAGLALGGYGPRSEVRQLQAQNERLRRGRRATTPIAGIVGGTWSRNDGRAQPPSPDPGPDPAPPDAPEGATPDEAPAAAEAADPGSRRPPSKFMSDEALVAMDLRRAQALAALEQQAGADEAQMEDVLTVVDDMNAELGALADALVTLAADREPSRHEMMALAADTLDVLLETEASLAEVFSEDQLTDLDPNILDPTAFVDRSVIERFDDL